MQNPIQKFGQGLFVFEKQGIFVWKIENFGEL